MEVVQPRAATRIAGASPATESRNKILAAPRGWAKNQAKSKLRRSGRSESPGRTPSVSA